MSKKTITAHGMIRGYGSRNLDRACIPIEHRKNLNRVYKVVGVSLEEFSHDKR